MSKRKTTRKRRWKLSSPESWPWWMGVAMVLLVFGALGAVMALVPNYSPTALRVAGAMTLSGVLAAALGGRTKSWWSQVAYMALWMLFFLGLGIRMWAAVIPAAWLWAPLVSGGDLVAGALAALHPEVSATLLREQLAPETRFGQGCLRVSLALLPGAGVSGYWVYEFSKRAGQLDILLLIAGGGSIAVATPWPQAASHQLWPRRPWAKKAEAESQAE